MNPEPILEASQAFARNFIPFLVTALSVMAGIYMIYSAVTEVYRKTDRAAASQTAGWGSIGLRLLVGGMCLRFGSTMQEISVLLTGEEIQDYRGVLAYAPLPPEASAWSLVFETCLLWVVMIGWAGAFRGLLLWNKATNGGGSSSGSDLFWQGTWHVLGGAAAINLTGMIKAYMGS